MKKKKSEKRRERNWEGGGKFDKLANRRIKEEKREEGEIVAKV